MDALKQDELFHQAVSAIDAGDVDALREMLLKHPELVRERLEAPGLWLRERIGDALDGFFSRPYLLWFVAEDPVRHGKLPANIVDVARTIVDAAKRENLDSLQEQLDYALRLVCWSWIARECGVQIGLIDVLLDAGASCDGQKVYEGRFGTHCDSAIYNGNFAAAEHLVQRGAALTLSTALCLNRWTDVERLAQDASLGQKQDAFVQAAMQGNAEALRKMLALGIDATTVSAQNQSHATSLHHAVWSGSLDAVKVLVEAGADLTRRDTIYDGTPLRWAEYGGGISKDPSRAEQYAKVAAYLRSAGAIK